MSQAPVEIMTESPEQTMDWAAAWAKTLPRGTVIALHGDLGSGKTCFVQGLAKGLEIAGAVHSPTFTLVNEYRGRLPLYHLDLYRLHTENEAWDIGVESYLQSDGITAIEWADRIQHILPENTRHVRLEHGPEPHQRFIKLDAGATS